MPGRVPRPCGSLQSSRLGAVCCHTRGSTTTVTAVRTGDSADPFHANPFHANLFHRAATAHFFPGRAGAAEYLFHRAAARPERGCSQGGGAGPGSTLSESSSPHPKKDPV